MKYINIFLGITLAFVILVSCTSNPEKSGKSEDSGNQSTEVKKLVDPEVSDQEQADVANNDQLNDNPTIEPIVPANVKPAEKRSGVSVYKPRQTAPSGGWPLIIFLDPHAQGSLPLSLYQDLAEEYGFLLIGSNEIMNGMPGKEIIASFDKMLATAKIDFPVDQNRIYFMGFSGGARLGLAFAEAYPEIKAMVACGAGIQAGVQAPKPTFSYLGMGGNEDFNMIEIINTDRTLKRQGFNRALVIFDGDHNWPPEPVALEAFQWFELVAMKDNAIAKDNAAIQTAKKWYLQKINSLKNAGRIFDSYEVAERAVSVLDGLADVSDLKQLGRNLRENPAYKEQLSSMVKSMQVEMGLQNSFMQAFAGKDMEWWTAELQKLNEEGANEWEQRMNKRLLAYLGIMSYMMSDRAVNEKDVEGSAKYLEIYRLLEPANPEHAYLEAKRRMMMNEKSRVIDYLKLAVVLGFNDKYRLFSEPAFSPLHNDPEFIALLQ